MNNNSKAPLLSKALSAYLKLKGEGKDKRFIIGANRNIKYVIKLFGNLPIDKDGFVSLEIEDILKAENEYLYGGIEICG